MAVLVTGVAGFIGAAVAERLLARGEAVIGIDDFNDYYDPAVKRARIARVVAQGGDLSVLDEIGRASCRERVCQHVKTSVVAVSLKTKTEPTPPTPPKD